MFQEIILFLISSLSLGTWCAAPEAPEATTASHGQPKDIQPRPIEQHFCCTSVDTSGKGSGEGCTAVGPELINACDNVLYCSGNWAKKKDTTECL